MTSRRKFLSLSASVVSLGLAGCMDDQEAEEPQPEEDDQQIPDDLNVENPTPVSQQEFDDWEPDTNCGGDQPDSMINSEISVSETTNSIGDGFNPVSYDSLPQSQKEILAVVLTERGYATCEESDAFGTFLEDAVEASREQENDSTSVYLEYEETYYKLYLRRADQVYAY